MGTTTTTIIDTTTTTTGDALSDAARQRIIRYLDDLIALETSFVTGLKDMAGDATDPQDAAMFEEHRAQTESQQARLTARMHELGGTPNALKGAMNKFGILASDLLHASKDKGDKATRNLIEAFAIENTEIASYESLIGAATAVGDTQTAQLAKEIQAEEQAAAQKLFARINPMAQTAMLAGIAQGHH